MPLEKNNQAIRLALRLYLRQAKRNWHITIPALILPATGWIFIFYVPPLILAKILALFQTKGSVSMSELAPYIGILTGLWMIGEILFRIGMHLDNRSIKRGSEQLYIDGMDLLIKKDLAFFHSNFAGSLTKKVIGFGRRYEDFIGNFSMTIIPNFLPLIFISVVLGRFSIWLVVFLIGMITLTIGLMRPLIKRRQKLVAEREDAGNIMAGHIADVITNIDAVKAFAREDDERQVHYKNVSELMNITLRSWDYHNLRIDTVSAPLYVATNVCGLIIALYISQRTGTNIEAVFLTFSYYASATRIIWEFNRMYKALETTLTDAAQFTELLLEKPAITDPENPMPFKPLHGTVEFSDVTFRYETQSEHHVFENFNLHIKQNEKIALVGHSGSGKSTLTKLLLRFMDIETGEIRIGGQNIAQISQAALRSHIAYVPQDPIMFHRSLADNIRYGKPHATDKEIRDIAKEANALEFIEALPDSFNTLVGERGVKLSGGQRQRVAIARAMIKDAPILILDEATSALDSESESFIQDALWKLMKNRTVIVIAHRLSTIQHMDRIIVLEKGKIIEQGTHTKLVSQEGLYSKLWNHQSGGFLSD